MRVEDVTDLIIGKRYRIKFSDCCISGEFTGTLLEKQPLPDHPGFIGRFVFDIGYLVDIGQVDFEDVDEEVLP